MGSRSKKIVELSLEKLKNNVLYNCNVIDNALFLPYDEEALESTEENSLSGKNQFIFVFVV